MRKFLSFNFWVNLPETDLIMNRHHSGIPIECAGNTVIFIFIQGMK
jgi:hypothetical protein